MKRRQALRGRGSFVRLFVKGVRLEGDLLRCFFIPEKDVAFRLQVGYTVSSRVYNAVQRNRMRRLMREAFAREETVLGEILERIPGSVSILFQLKTINPEDVKRLKLVTVHRDLSTLCRSLAASLLNRIS